MPVNYAELTQAVLNTVEITERGRWDVAEYARLALDDCGVTARQVASDWGFGAATIRKWAACARMWPDADDRLPTLTLSHYILALGADDPRAAIEAAADAQWSTRQLRDALRAAGAPDPTADRRDALEGAWRGWVNAWTAAAEAGDMATLAAQWPAVAAWIDSTRATRRGWSA